MSETLPDSGINANPSRADEATELRRRARIIEHAPMTDAELESVNDVLHKACVGGATMAQAYVEHLTPLAELVRRLRADVEYWKYQCQSSTTPPGGAS